jgi:hypothetical protein
MSEYAVVFALGGFFANWLVVPLIFRSRTHKDGFFIGVIAAILVLVIYAIIGW